VDWPEVVIVGFGPAGQAVGRAVAPTGRRVLVLDLNSAAKSAAEAMGLTAVIGDATQMEVLEHSHLQHARLVVITLPARSAALTVLQHVRTLAPTAQVIVRSRYQMHQADFAAAGAHVVVGDEERVGRGLSTAVLDHVERNLFRSPQ
jgi:CPA2 family monovalent cation:H+ antiporter-2